MRTYIQDLAPRGVQDLRKTKENFCATGRNKIVRRVICQASQTLVAFKVRETLVSQKEDGYALSAKTTTLVEDSNATDAAS